VKEEEAARALGEDLLRDLHPKRRPLHLLLYQKVHGATVLDVLDIC
jgi:hypothetical protein